MNVGLNSMAFESTSQSTSQSITHDLIQILVPRIVTYFTTH